MQPQNFKTNILRGICPQLVSMVLLGLILAFGGIGQAAGKDARRQIWSGYLLDGVCSRERFTESALGEKHTRKCLQMPICDRSGFGVLLDGNRFIKFDQAGNRKVRKMLPSMTKDEKIRIRVSGTLRSDVISVYTLDLEQ